MNRTYIEEQRHEAIAWAQRMMAHDFLVLDLETTDLNGTPIQIAIINQDGESVFDSLINPGKFEIHPKAQEITGITSKMVEYQHTFAEVHLELYAYLAGNGPGDPQIIIAYNVAFDRRIFNAAEVYAKLTPIPWTYWQCAMENYAKFYGEWNSYHGSFKWQSLEKACKQQNITVNGKAHEALTDARMTLALVKHMAGK